MLAFIFGPPLAWSLKNESFLVCWRTDFIVFTPFIATSGRSHTPYEGGVYTLTETGILSRFEAKTGKLTYKTRIDPAATAFTTSPWAYNGKLFCLSEEGQTFVIAAGETFKLLHVNALDEMTQATPAIVGERLLVRTESKLYSIRRSR